MKVCYFGAYDPEYTRVRVFHRGLRDNGVEVVECRSTQKTPLLRFPHLVWKFFRYARDADLVMVNEAGQVNMPAAKFVSLLTGKPVILDAYLSKYLVSVTEADVLGTTPLQARFLHLVESRACRMADRILVDTPETRDYFVEEYGLGAGDVESVTIGADEDWFRPAPPRRSGDGTFNVTYVGTFYRLHGAEHVVAAAALLKDHPEIRFDFYGSGPLRPQAESHARELALDTVRFHGRMPPHEVPALLASADLCLGIFGGTRHAEIVIPCKVYEALASARPVLTADTPAVRRLLRHRESAYLCEAANPEAIASAVLELCRDAELRERIAANGLARFNESATRGLIGAHVKAICEDVLARKRGRP